MKYDIDLPADVDRRLPEPKESVTSPRQIVSRALTYLQNQQGRMRYPEYRKLGLPITSSQIGDQGTELPPEGNGKVLE